MSWSTTPRSIVHLLLLCAGLARLAAAGDAAPDPAGGGEALVRAQRLVEAEETYWNRSSSTGLSVDAHLGGELEDLCRASEVREWMRRRILAIQERGHSTYMADRLFAILVLGGVTPEDVELVRNLAEPARGGSRLGLHAGRLLGSAPMAMSPLLAERLLALLCDRALATQAPELALPIWLLAKRLGSGTVRAALQAAWKKAGGFRAGGPNEGYGLCEIALEDPEGKPITGPEAVFRPGRAGPLHAIVWPDGKVRLRESLANEARRSEDLRLEVHGYYELEKPLKLEFVRGSVKRLTARLARERSRARGRLKTPPAVPLFARAARGPLPGFSPDIAGSVPDGLCDPVAADGSFAAPYSRRDEPDGVVFHDAGGRAILRVAAEFPAEGGDVDLGEVDAGPPGDIADVPIAIAWPAGQVGEDHLFARIHWNPRTPGVPGARSVCRLGTLAHLTGGGPARCGMARNLRPGPYGVRVEFDRDLAPIDMEFTVGPGLTAPLVLEPRIDPPPAAPEKPAVSHPIVAAGSWLRLRPGAGGDLHLLWSERHDLKLRSGKGEALGRSRTLYARTLEEDPLVFEVELRVGPDGDLHAFALFGQSARHMFPRYARFSPAGEPRGAWIDLGRLVGGEFECWGLPGVIFLGKDALLTLSPYLGEEKELAVGRIEGGAYRKVRSLTADHRLHIAGGFSRQDWNHIESPILCGKDERTALFLFPQKDRIVWSGLDRIQPRPATGAVPGMREPTSAVPGEGIIGRDGKLHLVLAVPPSDGAQADKLWHGAGAPGRTLSLQGLARPVLGTQESLALAEDPAGDIHLFAFCHASGLPGARNGHLIHRPLGGKGAREPRLTPWRDLYGMRGEVHAAFAGPRAYVAWESNRRIYLRAVDVEGGAEKQR